MTKLIDLGVASEETKGQYFAVEHEDGLGFKRIGSDGNPRTSTNNQALSVPESQSEVDEL